MLTRAPRGPRGPVAQDVAAAGVRAVGAAVARSRGAGVRVLNHGRGRVHRSPSGPRPARAWRRGRGHRRPVDRVSRQARPGPRPDRLHAEGSVLDPAALDAPWPAARSSSTRPPSPPSPARWSVRRHQRGQLRGHHRGHAARRRAIASAASCSPARRRSTASPTRCRVASRWNRTRIAVRHEKARGRGLRAHARQAPRHRDRPPALLQRVRSGPGPLRPSTPRSCRGSSRPAGGPPAAVFGNGECRATSPTSTTSSRRTCSIVRDPVPERPDLQRRVRRPATASSTSWRRSPRRPARPRIPFWTGSPPATSAIRRWTSAARGALGYEVDRALQEGVRPDRRLVPRAGGGGRHADPRPPAAA